MKYPNLNKLNNEFTEILTAHLNAKKITHIYLSSWDQLWPNTAGGFSEPGMWSGDAMTYDVVTVLSAVYLDKNMREAYVNAVYFGNKLAYAVHGNPEVFSDDVALHQIASVGKARIKYPGIFFFEDGCVPKVPDFYRVMSLEICEKTEEDHKIEFEITKLEHDSWKDKSFEDFKKFKQSWGEWNYAITEGPDGCFDTYDEAAFYVTHNIGDIHETCYNYVVIVPVYTGSMFTHVERKQCIPFIFDSETKSYKPAEKKDPMTKFAVAHASQYFMEEDCES